ncbi:MAG: hypothetical protein ACE5GZ_03400 [Gammaproteobacteria bacterium]
MTGTFAESKSLSLLLPAAAAVCHPSGCSKKMEIGFLFNHDGAHQVAHSAPIAFAFARRYPEVATTIVTSSEAERIAVDTLSAGLGGDLCRRQAIGMSGVQRFVEHWARSLSPYKRLAMLRNNLETLARFDALVVPEKTSLLLKRRFGLADLKLIHTRHGAGDRAVGFNDESGAFDFVLLPGRKIRDRLLKAGLLRTDAYAIVGYPKFDTIARGAQPKLFANDKPVVLYNPHFDPRLSSWYAMGREVLRFFRDHDDYNLVFAPHVMLFKRRLHIAAEDLRARLRRGIPKGVARCRHILVDTGSAASCDMTYSLAAHIYLGDVSSQVYEFLIRPRPCVFLDAHGAAWRRDPSYVSWRFGPVIDRVSELDRALAHARRSHAAFRAAQEAMFAYTFDLTTTSSSVRAADAIAAFLGLGTFAQDISFDEEAGAVMPSTVGE